MTVLADHVKYLNLFHHKAGLAERALCGVVTRVNIHSGTRDAS